MTSSRCQYAVVAALFAVASALPSLAQTNRVKIALAEPIALPALFASPLAPVAPDPVQPVYDSSALEEIDAVAEQAIAVIMAIDYVKKLPPEIMSRIVALVKANKLDPEALKSIVALIEIISSENIHKDTVSSIVALVEADALTVEDLVGISALAAKERLPEEVVKAIAAIVAIKHSRFEGLTADAFSTLWAIKMRGIAAEEKGENAEEEWRKYWEMFSKINGDNP